MEIPNNKLCNKHDGFRERFSAAEDRITKLEDSVKRLWARVDKIVLLGVLILGTVVANLVAILWK